MTARTMSVAEVAERLGKTPMWLTIRLRNGTFPGHKLGQDWRLTEDDYTAILELTQRKPLPRPASSMTRTTRRNTERHTQ